MLNELTNNYADYEYLLATSQLVLAMLGMGALMSPRDFILEIKQPKGLNIGLLFQWLLVPLIAFALASILPIPAGIGAGLIMIAAVPGGTLSNILTLFGRGNIALSISLTAITTVAALVVTPLLLELFISQYLPEDFKMPTGRVLREIVLTLLLPLSIGMLIRKIMEPEHSHWCSKWAIRLSLAMIVLMAVGAGGSGRLDPQAYGVAGITALVALGLAIQISAALVCTVAGLRPEDRLAIVIEASFRNVSLGVAIKALAFPAATGVMDPIGDAILFTLLLYAGVSLAMCLIPIAINRRWLIRRN